jgi:TetR/AcrR family transcriptional regulator, transcriptional repressor for nem operon
MKIFYNKEFILNVTKEKLSSYIEMKYGPLLAIEDNFIDGIVKVIKDRKDFDFKCGCKLNNLVQELSYKDENFKSSLEKIYLRFENIFEQVLNKAIEKKEIIKTNTNELSVFTVASIEGCISTAKKSQNEILYNSCISHLEKYLNSYKILK